MSSLCLQGPQKTQEFLYETHTEGGNKK